MHAFPRFMLATLLLSGCATRPAPAPADAFFARLSALCGQAFTGRVVTDTPPPAGADPFAAGPLVMHVRECTPDTLRIPFHVGDDHSRTWVVTRTATGLRLKHDHRHQDGSEDLLTQYGGDSGPPGTASRQAFPADAHSRALFTAQGRSASIDNTWALEFARNGAFAYELTRPARAFRVEFDLGRPVAPPPAPWGARD